MYLVNVKLALPGILVALSLVLLFSAVRSPLSYSSWVSFSGTALLSLPAARPNKSARLNLCWRRKPVAHRKLRILASEILPNILNSIIVVATLEMAIAILVEAALSFPRARHPTPNAIVMGADGVGRPQLHVLQALPDRNSRRARSFLLVIAINMMGDGVRDVTAPEGRN